MARRKDDQPKTSAQDGVEAPESDDREHTQYDVEAEAQARETGQDAARDDATTPNAGAHEVNAAGDALERERLQSERSASDSGVDDQES